MQSSDVWLHGTYTDLHSWAINEYEDAMNDAPSCTRLGCDCADRRDAFREIVRIAAQDWKNGVDRLDVIVNAAESEWFGPETEDE